MLKEHREFFAVEMDSGWHTPPGYPAGIEQKILSGHLDEELRTGMRTRLLRFAPGVRTTMPFEHEYWEEVTLVSGDLEVGGQTYLPYTYACRPPHVPHGPFSSEQGCLLLEVHFFAREVAL